MIGLNDLTTHHIVLQLYMLLILSNVLIFNAVLSLDHNAALSLDHRLPKDLIGIRFVDYFLKPHYTSHIIKYVSL